MSAEVVVALIANELATIAAESFFIFMVFLPLFADSSWIYID